MKFLVPLLNTVGMFIEPSILFLTLVIIYCDDPTVNSYAAGVPPGKRAAREAPLIVVVP